MNINRNQALDLLAQSLFQLQQETNRMRDEWLPEEPPFTVLMGALGAVLGASVGTLDDKHVERIAQVIETILRDGTEEVKNALATGLLESLMHSSDTEPGAIRLLRHL